MPGSRRLSVSSLSASVAGAFTLLVALAARASAAPTPSPTPSPSTSDNPCDLIVGLAKDYCEDGEKAAGAPRGGTSDPAGALDPLSSLARGCADAAAWIVGKLSDAVKETANVDFTNTAFLRQYAVVFAASTVLTLVLWLLAVAKRAIRGVPLTTAISEAIGFLWLTVLASAFTPSSSSRSSPRPTASPRSSPAPPAARPTSSSAVSPRPSRRVTTSAAGRSC